MFNSEERYIQFHELYLITEPKEAPVIDLKRIVPELIKRIENKTAKKTIANGNATLSISDYDYNEKDNILILTVHNSDKTATDPAFKNDNTGNVRIEKKKADEGVAVSSHVAISLTPNDKLQTKFDFLLETMTGLSRSTLTPFLKSEIKSASDNLGLEFEDKDTNTNKPYKLAGEINATPSKKFIDELNDGNTSNITGFELVRHNIDKSFDEDGFYAENITRTYLKRQKPLKGKIQDIIKSIQKKAKEEEYDEVKIKYTSDDKAHTASLHTTKQDLKDILICKEKKIKSPTAIQQCEKEILPIFKNKLTKFIKELREDRN